MRLIELTLTNLGVYRGTQHFDLNPDAGPIILFGGKNGAGKTTLLESLRLCLYGQRALGDRVPRRVYESYLADRIHRIRDASVPIDHASIALRFDYARFGESHEYEVTRAWRQRGSTLQEDLFVKQDGALLSGLPEDQWQDFLNDLIPPGLTALFFFDGEKIQSLATDSLSDQSLGEAIKQLLGLDVVERLQGDLDIYLKRQRRESAVAERNEQLQLAEQERDQADEAYDAMVQDLAQTRAKIDQTMAQIQSQEQNISRESSGFALKRDEIKSKLAETEAELGQVERHLRELAAGLMPFTLVPALCHGLTEQLSAEAQHQQWQSSAELLEPRLKGVEGSLQSGEFWAKFNGSVSEDARASIAGEISGLLQGLLERPPHLTAVEPRHHLSEPERAELLSWMSQLRDKVPSDVIEYSNSLEKLTRRRQRLSRELRKIPEDDVLAPLMDELNVMIKRLGTLEAQAARQDGELSVLRHRREEARRKLWKSYEDLEGSEATERRLDLVAKVQTVLDGYLGRLTEVKVKALEEIVGERFNELARKPDLIQRITIDPETFAVTLFDGHGQTIGKDGLSAGEKQIFAIATLWALRQLSGRPLPVIIDTPLGRLDSEHRQNLVERYFPRTSHQVVLFSTDTEIDRQYFDTLRPHISRAYHLSYASDAGATQVDTGYFWQQTGE